MSVTPIVIVEIQKLPEIILDSDRQIWYSFEG